MRPDDLRRVSAERPAAWIHDREGRCQARNVLVLVVPVASDLDGFGQGEDERTPLQKRSDVERDDGLFHIGRLRDEHGMRSGRPYESRRPCDRCGGTDAWLIERGGQNTVRCAVCNILLYNAPKTETGQRPRTVKTLRKGIKPSQQARILDRDLQRCVMCGADDQRLTIGHLLSIDDGTALGATMEELNSDPNLAAMCETCNLGLQATSISPRSYAAIMLRLIRAELRRQGGRSPDPAPVGSRDPGDGHSG